MDMHYVLHKYLQIIIIIEFIVKRRSNFYLMMSTVGETIYCISNVCLQSLNNIFSSSTDMVKSHTERRVIICTQKWFIKRWLSIPAYFNSNVETNTAVSHMSVPLITSIVYEDLSLDLQNGTSMYRLAQTISLKRRNVLLALSVLAQIFLDLYSNVEKLESFIEK